MLQLLVVFLQIFLLVAQGIHLLLQRVHLRHEELNLLVIFLQKLPLPLHLSMDSLQRPLQVLQLQLSLRTQQSLVRVPCPPHTAVTRDRTTSHLQQQRLRLLQVPDLLLVLHLQSLKLVTLQLLHFHNMFQL